MRRGFGYFDTSGSGSGDVVNTAVPGMWHTGTVQLNGIGNSAEADPKKLGATSVASVSNLTGANVAKAGGPRAVRSRG